MKAIWTFITTAYALSISLSLVVGLTGGNQSPLFDLRYLSMFLPAIAVLVVSIAMNEQPNVCWDHFPLKYLPVALFLIPCVFHAAMLVVAIVLLWCNAVVGDAASHEALHDQMARK